MRGLLAAQDGAPATLGTTIVIPGGLSGRIYELPIDTGKLPDFRKLDPIGTIYTKALWVPPLELTGLSGVTTRIQWFAIDFSGKFYVSEPATYRLSIRSDDGSKLYIGGQGRLAAEVACRVPDVGRCRPRKRTSAAYRRR